MKKQIILKWIILSIAIVINLFIIINAFINGEASAKESYSVAHTTADVINTVKPETITPQNFERFAFNLRKALGHFMLFALSGGFSTFALYLFINDKKCGYFVWELLITFGFGIALALLSEFVQHFTKQRTGSFIDVGIDLLGYFIGVFPVFLILFLKKSRIFYKQNYLKK